ncbi:MAG: cell wall hydrolase [Bacillota bacterium]
MQHLKWKGISLLLILFLLTNTFTFFFLGIGSSTAAAASIEEEDVFTGIGLMLLLLIFADNDDSGPSNLNNMTVDRFSSEDINILAKAIHAEARGESYQGKVAVGAVIINRVYHPSFPNTIKKVIYQSGQFTSVENGQINLSPNSDSYKAAYEAAEGNDPSRGSLYFYNPDKSRNPDFFAKREKIVRIGNHVFLK